ncbi:MAG: hypothetical protein POELPBGB_00025 [Bacteroidia bacterium]|nr:hypothetical protein [Bacteroidia bacterium]
MKNITLSLAAVLLFSYTYAQKAVLKSGSVKGLKGQSELNVEFDYSQLKVGSGKKAQPEAAYTAEKVAEHNKKEAGKGDKWLEGWNSAPDKRYKPKFFELLNDGLKKSGVTAGEGKSGAKYTLVVKTTRLEPGWNIGISKMPAFADMVYELKEGGNVVATIEILNSPGSQFSGYDFDAGTRLAEAYAKSAKTLAAFISKQIK